MLQPLTEQEPRANEGNGWFIKVISKSCAEVRLYNRDMIFNAKEEGERTAF